MRNLAVALLMGGALQASPVFADAADGTLTVAFPGEMPSLDSYTNARREGVILSRHIWDGLIYRDPDTNEYVGNLAKSWRWVDDLTLEFELREGISFHNGEKFDADDVVHTMNFVADPENAAQPRRNVDWIAGGTKIDENTVQINLKSPFPAALEYLAGPVVIYPNEYHSQVGASGMGEQPIGTGPYQVESFTQAESITLTRYEGYHQDSPKGQPTIDQLIWRTIPEQNTQYAELISGGVDWIWQVPSDQADRFAQRETYNVINETTMRIGYLGFDASDRYAETPFDDVRVRQAVAHAIDRTGMVDSLLRGASVVVNSACFPSQFGCEQDVQLYEYDPEKARALLADAGYPDGFEIDLSAYRNRDYAEAMMANLADVGIRTTLNYLKYPAMRDQIQNGEVPFVFSTWGSFSINDTSAITSHFFRGGLDDYARDPDVIAWLTEADNVTDRAVREQLYSSALKRIAEQAYWLPLFSYNANYVYSKGLNFTPTPDEIPRFFTASW
ncbi:MAG: ABC transporter substrate-binding protein [Sulfitobacter sp.]